MSIYQIEDCSSSYRKRKIAEIPIYIFEDHSLALPVWGMVSSRLNKKLNLVTFDAHTDTHPSFNSYIFDETAEAPAYGEYGLRNPIISNVLKNKHFKRNDFSFEDVYSITVTYLKNTEQIMTGVDLGYLSSYTVVNRDDDISRGYEQDDRKMGYKATYLSRTSWNAWSGTEVHDPVVVDFDLDFFGCRADMDDLFKQKVLPLIKRAKAITIAREQYFFENCKSDNEYTNEQALEQLLAFVENILTEKN